MTITTPEIRPADAHTPLRVLRLHGGSILLVAEGVGKLHCPGGAPFGAEFHGEDCLEITPSISVGRFEVCVLVDEGGDRWFWESTAVSRDGDGWVTGVELARRSESEARARERAQYYRDVEAGLYPEDEW